MQPQTIWKEPFFTVDATESGWNSSSCNRLLTIWSVQIEFSLIWEITVLSIYRLTGTLFCLLQTLSFHLLGQQQFFFLVNILARCFWKDWSVLRLLEKTFQLWRDHRMGYRPCAVLDIRGQPLPFFLSTLPVSTNFCIRDTVEDWLQEFPFPL